MKHGKEQRPGSLSVFLACALGASNTSHHIPPLQVSTMSEHLQAGKQAFRTRAIGGLQDPSYSGALGVGKVSYLVQSSDIRCH